jgi:uncharacterized repeat protein (TIGR01451 family)
MMDTRASTRARLSVLPVLIALTFNLMAPVLSVALPAGTPEALSPRVAEAAADPQHVNITLQGCRNPSVNLETTNFVCADGDYTTGNLGKTWNELDLVPHRITTSLGTQAAATELYTVGVVADHLESGVPGYDFISVPVVNAAKSHASCSVSASALLTATPGIGGTDTSMYRLLDISQAKGSTCVFDYYERLAIGSHKFPGSSLHSNLTNQSLGSAGIGNKDVSIPVKEILPQEIEKTMSATRGQSYGWSINKSADPTTLHFPNTCLETAGARSATVNVTVTWTRSGPTASGVTTLTTNIYATNPAHRSVIVQVTDHIYEGAGQTVLLDTATSAPVSVAAGAQDVLILTHEIQYTGEATTFNDVATATYVDEDLEIPVPGTTQATASATTQPAAGPITDASVLITDTESITGDGLSFSVATPSLGAFTGGYVAGTATTGPVGWQYTATDSGSVTFTKTVLVDGPMITSGTLSDLATIVGAAGTIASANASTSISTDALVSLAINKQIPSGSLRSGESVTFNFAVYAGTEASGTPIATPSITISHPNLSGSVNVNGLEPGTYTVRELPLANWASHSDQTTTIALPSCSGSVSFNNSTLAPDLSIEKTADAGTVDAGDPIGFSIVVSNDDEAGTGIAKDVTLTDALPGSSALGVSWQVDEVLLDGSSVGDPSAYCQISGSAPTQTLNCEFGDLAPGGTAEVKVSSATSAPEGCETATLRNTAKAQASNHDEIQASASVTIECPDLEITKSPDGAVVSAGDDISFTITVTNHGPGSAKDVVLDDELPAGFAWAEDPDLAECAITDGSLHCDIGDLAEGESFSVTVTASTSGEHCGENALVNTAVAGADNHADVSDTGDITIDCPDVRVDKEPVSSPISAGEQAQFTILVWNDGPGVAYDVEVTDTLPAGTIWELLDDGGMSCSTELVPGQQSITCSLDELAPGAENALTIVIGYETTQDDCGTLNNLVTVLASNEPEANASNNSDTALVVVECPGLNIVKTADADSIVAGDEASFTITVWNNGGESGNGTAFDVVLHDELPAGLSWEWELLQGSATCAVASSVEEGQPKQQSIDCELGTLEPSTMEGGVIIRVFAETTREDCGMLLNEAWAEASNSDRVSDDAEMTVTCPTLTIEKEADADEIVISGPNDDLQVDPAVITWTLTYTLTDGPVTNAVITDELPTGLVYVPDSASDGGVYDAATNTLTWTFPTLSASGSVTFRTTVDPETISRVAPTVNVAVISSDQTPEDEGQDQVSVVVEPPPLAGTPTPRESTLPDTASGVGINGEPITIPVELLVLMFLGSLGALALANVRTARSRGR